MNRKDPDLEQAIVPILSELSQTADISQSNVTDAVDAYLQDGEPSYAIYLVLYITERAADLIRVDAQLPKDRMVQMQSLLSPSFEKEASEQQKVTFNLVFHIIGHHINHDYKGATGHVLEAAGAGWDLFSGLLASTLTVFSMVARRRGMFFVADEDGGGFDIH